MKTFYPVLVILMVSLLALPFALAQKANPGDDDGKPKQTEKILLKDGSEKKHRAPKKESQLKPEASPSDKAPGETKTLPTDVD